MVDKKTVSNIIFNQVLGGESRKTNEWNGDDPLTVKEKIWCNKVCVDVIWIYLSF